MWSLIEVPTMSEIQNQLHVSEIAESPTVGSAPQVPLAMHLPKSALASIRRRAAKLRSQDAEVDSLAASNRRQKLIRQIIARG